MLPLIIDAGIGLVGDRVRRERLALLGLAGNHNGRGREGEDIGPGIGRVVEDVSGRLEGLRGRHAAVVQEFEVAGDD